MDKVILIGGSGRSGSNVLKYLLSGHPGVGSLPFEPRYVLDADGIVDFYSSFENWSPYLIDSKLKRLKLLFERLSKRSGINQLFANIPAGFQWNKRLFSPPKYYQWELEKHIPGFIERTGQLFEKLNTFDFQSYWIGSDSFQYKGHSLFSPVIEKEELRVLFSNFIAANIASTLQLQNKEIYVDDSTFNVLHADSLLELLPNSKLIHIYRSPKDVISSLQKQNWAPSNLQHLAIWYASVIKKWWKIKSKLPTSYYLEVKFEDLVLHPKESLETISNFADVDFKGLDANFDLSKHNIGRSKAHFSVEEDRFLSNSLSEIIQAYGYG